MKNQGTIAQIQCPEPVTERHRLTVPASPTWYLCTKSSCLLLLLFAFCSIMTVTKHEKEVSRYDYDSRLRPLDRASRRH